ncbi:MAG: phosphoribosylanthranilate isomerase [Xanthomonadales bacterium]|nr:phosphoribosylanthranilate isomerase [Xanthomonadales bacterium]
MNNVRVKICGLTRDEDVAAAVGCGVDALGFVFVPDSKRCITAATATRLCQLVPAFISRVGLFLDQPVADIEEILQQVPLSALQFHGRESAEFCRQFMRPYIKSVSLEAGSSISDLEHVYPDAAAILVDSHEPGGLGGTGKTLDWQQVQPGSRPLILAGGLNPQNVAAAIQLVRPWAVDVSSGVEFSPGIKDAAAIKLFISEARQ